MDVVPWPAKEVFATMRRIEDAAAAIPDPLDRARALEVAGGGIPDLQRSIRKARAAAIAQALATRTATSVAADLGISRARLYQILGDLQD